MLDGSWIYFVLKGFIYVIKLVIYKRICNAHISDFPSNGQK